MAERTKEELIKAMMSNYHAKKMLYSGHETYEMKLMKEVAEYLRQEDKKK